MRNRPGVTIEKVLEGSPASKAGISAGDVLLYANGQPVFDVIDFMFAKDGPEITLTVSRKGRRKDLRVELAEGEDPGIELRHFKVKTCRNRCVFCFVSQLPRGLRKSLYVKDEDYRMSFLYGNYLTLTNLGADEKRRIVDQRLSPIYVSVHTTDTALRARMLGNQKAPDIMRELRFFREQNIRIHTQVVLCPGLNDGPSLKSTVRDLYSLYPQLQSIAVVPVGLTAQSRSGLKPMGQEDAVRAIEAVEAFQKRFRKKHGDPIVYCSDEIYIKAGRPFPPLNDYGDLPQIENGVGMVPLFLSQARRLKPFVPADPKARFVTFTGLSFYPYLKKFTDRLERQGINIRVVPVENTFFGSSITVAGLLTGRDVIKALQEGSGSGDVLLVPDVVLREAHDVFLDDVSLSDIESALGVRARVVSSTPEGLEWGIARK